MGKFFLVYGVRIDPEHIEDLAAFLEKTDSTLFRMMLDKDYLVGMAPKECHFIYDGLHEFDLTKIDFKQLEKKVLDVLKQARVTTDFLKFNLYSGNSV